MFSNPSSVLYLHPITAALARTCIISHQSMRIHTTERGRENTRQDMPNPVWTLFVVSKSHKLVDAVVSGN